ncbi:MAG: hypothetical protein NUV53_01470 [Patescibacteria group bacterium]|nr:hypothetical protein [Patescibacteria group bacterium]
MSQKQVAWVFIIVTFGIAVFRPDVAFWLRAVIQGGGSVAVCSDERAELVVLKTELARYSVREEVMLPEKEKSLIAEVYSQYPFGLKNELLVNRGSNDGVQEGQPATFKNVFIGRVVKVFPRVSLIQTIFDVQSKYAVRIGAKGSDALLTGGTVPLLTLIPKDGQIAVGDAVYMASPMLPYGMPLGTLRILTKSRDGLFRESELDISYDLGEIRAVAIIVGYIPPVTL